ncbi:zinc finger protein Pegasus-like isoform X1 [Branchiostoma lanceolatum]|uniref:zinc finger protein Pegasus-like isoform X1 n=1 Tax=Branchiostoma lanceolatum TaxID=7740 RepID=UPI0034522827
MEPGATDTSMISEPPQDPEVDADKERPYKCRFCNYAATQRTHLRCHERTHTGEKPYKCNMCGYAAAQKTNLNSHMRVHSGERPYKCKMCPYAAIQRSNLTSHYRAKHGVQKPTIYIEHDSPPRMVVDQPDGDAFSEIAAAHGIEQVPGFSNTQFTPYPNHGEHSPGLTMIRTPTLYMAANGNHFDVPVSNGSYTARQSERTSSTTSSSVQGEEIMDLTCIKKEEEAVVVVSESEVVSKTSQTPDYNKDEVHTSSGNERQRQDNESPGTNVRCDETQRQMFHSPGQGQNTSNHNHNQQNQETHVHVQKNYISEENSPHYHQMQRNNSYPGSGGNTENTWTENCTFVREDSHDEASLPSDECQSADDSAAQFSSPQVQRQVPSLRSSPGAPTHRHVCRFCDISFGDYLMYTVHRGFHTYGDPLRCNMCGVKYRIPLEFFVHTHSGVHGHC